MPKDNRKSVIRDHKIKKLAAAHPNSRKASQIHQDLLHDDKKSYHLATKDLKWKPQVKKFEWFQKAVWMDQKHAYTKAELLNLAIEFITRNDDEIREAVKSASAGGGSGSLAKTSKIGQKLNLRIFEEEQLHRGEFMMPDLAHPKAAPPFRTRPAPHRPTHAIPTPPP